MPLKRKLQEEKNLPSLYFHFILPHLSGVISGGPLRSCQSAEGVVAPWCNPLKLQPD